MSRALAQEPGPRRSAALAGVPGSVDDDDGVLLVPTLAASDETTVVGVIDAHSMECLAELRAPQIVPFGFHAAFSPAR